jgi:hypothetical protein
MTGMLVRHSLHAGVAAPAYRHNKVAVSTLLKTADCKICRVLSNRGVILLAGLHSNTKHLLQV